MKFKKMSCIKSSTALAIALIAPISVASTDYPSHPISLVVPYGAAGGTDLFARAFAEEMSKILKQSIIVENKPGGNGTFGVTEMKRTKPDGYKLTLVPLSVFRQPYLQKVNYDPINDVTYISGLLNYTYAIGVRADSKWKTLEDLVSDGKDEKQFISYGTSALYSSNHLTMVELAKESGAQWTNVPFKSDAESITALLGKHVDVLSSNSTVLPFYQNGEIRVLATAGSKRPEDFKDVPTLKELGYDVTIDSLLGLGGPAGLPDDIVEKLDNAVKTVLASETFIEKARKIGVELEYRNHSEYTGFAKFSFENEKNIVEIMKAE